jgi:hypothetical protein
VIAGSGPAGLPSSGRGRVSLKCNDCEFTYRGACRPVPGRLVRLGDLCGDRLTAEVVFRPQHMTAEELQGGYWWIEASQRLKSFFSPGVRRVRL